MPAYCQEAATEPSTARKRVAESLGNQTTRLRVVLM